MTFDETGRPARGDLPTRLLLIGFCTCIVLVVIFAVSTHRASDPSSSDAPAAGLKVNTVDPLAALIDSHRAAAVPNSILIPALGVDAIVVAAATEIQYDPFNDRYTHSFGVPQDMTSTTWWSDGVAPGGPDMAVILGHSQIDGGEGVFNDLHNLSVGDEIATRDRSGKLTTFSVREVRNGIDKRDPDALADVLAANRESSALALVTCGGDFDASKAASVANTVVFATQTS